jgi:hypothetical protein
VLFLFRDQAPADLWTDIMTGESLGKAAYLLLIVWIVAVASLILKQPLYQFFEGYMLPRWLAKILTSRNQKYLRCRLREIRTLHERWTRQKSALTSAELNRYLKLRYSLTRKMPWLESDILPTRFGNAIKAFEVYPRDIYGADGPTMWLRLASVIPKPFLEQVQDTRTQIDCLINCCFFSAIIGLLGAVRAIGSGAWQTPWLLWTAGGMIAAYLFYQLAVIRVPAWGEFVMSAFDCYLPALATQLGFELPTTEVMRQRFWTTLSQQLIYRRGLDGKLPFRIEEWKQVQPKAPNKELTSDADTGHEKTAQENGHQDKGSEED